MLYSIFLFSLDMTSGWGMTIAIGFITIFSLYFLYFQRQTINEFSAKLWKEANQSDSSLQILFLLPEEENRFINTPSISTITFYKGMLPVNAVRDRLKEVMKVNPFLTSRLIHCSGSCRSATQTPPKVCAVHKKVFEEGDESDALDKYFRLVVVPNDKNDQGFNAFMPYEDLLAKLKSYHAPLGIHAIGRDESLFRVTILEIIPRDSYALMVSLSHVLGDGYTFYKVCAMLNPSTPLVQVTTQREEAFAEELRGNHQFSSFPWVIIPFLAIGLIYNKFIKQAMKPRIYCLDPTAIQAEKDAYQATTTASPPLNPPFLSTNDIITSWFFRFSNADFGFMIANFRNRKPYLSDIHAGNYVGRVLFLKSDMAKPEYVRQSLDHFRTASTKTTAVLTEIMRLNLSLITNWSTFYEEISFIQNKHDSKYSAEVEHSSNRCEQVLHLPVIEVRGTAVRQVMIVFQAIKGKLGVILWTRDIPSCRFESENLLLKKFS